MRVLGVDPGAKGGIVVVSGDAGHPPTIIRSMLMPLNTELTTKPTLDWWPARERLEGAWAHVAVIENVHAMPRQGVSSSFQFGRMFGAVEMLAAERSDVVKYVTPQKWKKHFGLVGDDGSDKYASTAKATEVFGSDIHWPLKKHEGIAEAALIALYGLTHFENEG